MAKKEKEDAIRALKLCMTQQAQTLHGLTKRRKEMAALIQEKDSQINEELARDVCEMREKERQNRLETYGQVEVRRQEITSALLMELVQICKEDEVPRYVVAIGKILDNYQGI